MDILERAKELRSYKQTTPLTIRLHNSTHSKARKICDRKKIKMNDLITSLTEDFLTGIENIDGLKKQ